MRVTLPKNCIYVSVPPERHEHARRPSARNRSIPRYSNILRSTPWNIELKSKFSRLRLLTPCPRTTNIREYLIPFNCDLLEQCKTNQESTKRWYYRVLFLRKHRRFSRTEAWRSTTLGALRKSVFLNLSCSFYCYLFICSSRSFEKIRKKYDNHDFFFHFSVKRSRNFDRYVTIRNHDRCRKFESVTSVDRRESLKSKNLHETLQILSIRENDSKVEIQKFVDRR